MEAVTSAAEKVKEFIDSLFHRRQNSYSSNPVLVICFFFLNLFIFLLINSFTLIIFSCARAFNFFTHMNEIQSVSCILEGEGYPLG